MYGNGFSNQAYCEDDISQGNLTDNEELKADSILLIDNDSLFSEFDEEEFHRLNSSRKECHGSSKWRIGPAPTSSSNDEIEIKIKIGSLAEINKTYNDKQNPISERTSQLLVKYFQDISYNKKSTFDYKMVSTLLELADVNTTDIYGQTFMHEVAREWHVDIARFLRMKGIDIDKPDNFGRTPLFVAAASDHFEMVKWLIENGAKMYHKCKRGQIIVHYAAFYNSINVMKVLVNFGVHPNLPDEKQQTPLFIAAKRGNLEMCNFLLTLEVPTASYCVNGSTSTTQILMNCSNAIAFRCLNQYIVVNKQTGKVSYHLSEFTRKRWALLSRKKHLVMEKEIYPSVLEIIVEKNYLDLITHPIITELISTMMSRFGARYLYMNIILNIIFTLSWTIATTIHQMNEKPTGIKLVSSIVFAAIGCILTVFFIVKILYEHRTTTSKEDLRKLYYLENIRERKSKCHPLWQQEGSAIDKELETALLNKSLFWSDTWAVIDLFCLIFTIFYSALEVACLVVPDVSLICEIRGYFSVVFLISVWFRLNRCLQILESMGQFISCFGHCLVATLQFSFLYLEFFVPLFCAFWVFFGGPRKENETESEYKSVNDMLYQLYLLTIVGDYEFDKLKEIDEIISQILVGLFLLLISCVCLNLYIALLSEAFVRVHSFATATARINQAKALLRIGNMFPDTMMDFEKYLMKECAPKQVSLRSGGTSEVPDQLDRLKNISSSLKTIISAAEAIKNDASSVVDKNEELKNEIERFEEQHPENALNKTVDQMFSIFEDHQLSFFKVQRKTRDKFVDLKEKALDEIPDAMSRIAETVSKTLGKSNSTEKPN